VTLNRRFVPDMYSSDLNSTDRAGTIALVALIHAALAYAFLNISGTMRVIEQQVIPQLIDLAIEPPPPPIVEVPLEKDKPKEKEGAASPENIKSTATPVAAPKPRIELPVPPPMPVTETPNTGSDPTQGAAPRPGPGTGAGGIGTGTGSGGSGSGTGGGGSGAGTRPVLITPTLEGRRDYPREVLRRWPRNGRVFVRFQVDVAGRPFNCNIDRSSGDPGVDQWTCSLVISKLRFRPATDNRGRPTISWYGYIQAPTNF
jgi:protein TonB